MRLACRVGERLVEISIHAPQWGATAYADTYDVAETISIHAPQWGATNRNTDGSSSPEFQSTHPSGVRLIQFQTLGLAVANFNPRTPVGCDHAAAQSFALTQISIHAPQWGATSGRLAHRVGDRFQSTHPSGGRLLGFLRFDFAESISIHAPQWGATAIPVR